MISSSNAATEKNFEAAPYVRPLVVDVDFLLHHRDLLADVLFSAPLSDGGDAGNTAGFCTG